MKLPRRCPAPFVFQSKDSTRECHETAALRDFEPADVRYGSFASD
jgi:hypothetical protein